MSKFQQEKLENFAQASNEYIYARRKWFKSVLVMASGLLGLSSQNDRLVLLSRLDIELRVEIIRIRAGFKSESDW
jgi:hypothetical protein